MNTIYAAPSARVRKVEGGTSVWASDLQTALNRAGPGDKVILLEGSYYDTAIVTCSGADCAPVRIVAETPGKVVLCGGGTREEGRNGMMDPMDGDASMLKLFGAEHVTIEGLSFRDCWPCAVYMRGCRNIVLRDCHGTRSRFFVYARQFDESRTYGITLEACSWVQDPDFDMWDGRVTWPEVKGTPKHFDASFFNGAMFGSFDIDGGVTIRHCACAHAFNVIRMDMRPRHVSTKGPSIARNRDVFIYDNAFGFIRDNAIEPEMGAQNWFVFNNRFQNCHAVFSLDQVALRDMFIIGNWILNDRRPGQVGQDNQGGKIFKFFDRKKVTGNDPIDPAPRKGLWSLFNSVQTRTSYTKKGETGDWTDRYTVLGHFPEPYPEALHPARRPFDTMRNWDNITVADMICTAKGFPDKEANAAEEFVSGQYIDPVFKPLNEGAGEGRPDPSQTLGGWDGKLHLCDAVAAIESEEITVPRADDQPDMVFPAGLPPGAQPIKDMNITGWPEYLTPAPDEV